MKEDDIEKSMEALRRVTEYVEMVEENYRLLASEMVYEGNSVAWWHSKAINYRAALGEAWNALEELGINADGKTSVADAIRGLNNDHRNPR